MNSRLFNKLMEENPQQHSPEWRTFLELCSAYLKKNKIKNPTVGEVGFNDDRQKKFWEQLFGAKYFGIGNPLHGKTVDVLFINNGCYGKVKKDFEVCLPLCSGIIAFHGIETYRYRTNKATKTWKFWDELKLRAYKGEEGYKDFLFLTIFNRRKGKHQMGIGIMIRK